MAGHYASMMWNEPQPEKVAAMKRRREITRLCHDSTRMPIDSVEYQLTIHPLFPDSPGKTGVTDIENGAKF